MLLPGHFCSLQLQVVAFGDGSPETDTSLTYYHQWQGGGTNLKLVCSLLSSTAIQTLDSSTRSSQAVTHPRTVWAKCPYNQSSNVNWNIKHTNTDNQQHRHGKDIVHIKCNLAEIRARVPKTGLFLRPTDFKSPNVRIKTESSPGM